MKNLSVLIIILVLLFALVPWTDAQKRRRAVVTPYGDFCPNCTRYGICKTAMSHEDAKKAMLDYYNKKGYVVEVESKRGRFIRAKIKDNGKVVDVVIFDRQTGRIRSIY